MSRPSSNAIRLLQWDERESEGEADRRADEGPTEAAVSAAGDV